MKRIWIVLLCLFLLCGCTEQAQEPTDAAEATVPTEPAKPWTDELGMPWDKEGVLLEMPLTVPDGLHYTSMVGFDGDLLLWSIDEHLEDMKTLELCLIELDDGSVKAQKDFSFEEVVIPQVLDDRIYLSDTTAGRITALDNSLAVVDSWSAEPGNATWFMGGNDILYAYDWESGLEVLSLSGGDVPELPALGNDVSNFYASDNLATMEYYDSITGEPRSAFVDIRSGEVWLPPVDLEYDAVEFCEDNWLFGKYADSHTFYLNRGDEPQMVETGQDMLSFLPEGYILKISEEMGSVSVYSMEGESIAGCRISEVPYTYSVSEFIWNSRMEGYFLVIGNYGSDQRLLFWDPEKGVQGEDLVWEPVPDPSEQEAAVKQRAAELEQKYGVTILVGEECDTVFDEFTATPATDWEKVAEALDTLDRAFSAYPDGFLKQLRYGDVRGIRIHLISDLQADGSGRYGGGYNAFTQEQWDHNLMVMDIDASWEITYYHEITHIIDNFLAWDSMNREDAVFSEEKWCELNPEWFPGYSYDYSRELFLVDDESFVDGYATISPTEDRARIMEYAMGQGSEWLFEDADVLMNKLDYYCRCIRDTFNTEGWPEELIWEQYLSLKD